MNSTLSQEQHEMRLGRFTGSEIYKLIPMGRRPMTDKEIEEAKKNKDKRRTVDEGFSDTGMTYIFEKAAEKLTGFPSKEEFTSAATSWGIEHEDEAMMYFEAAKEQKIIKGTTLDNGVICGTPDGSIEGKRIGFEIKCPFNSANHLKNLSMNSAEDLLKLRPEYYWQCVAYMWLTGFESWKFCSYDPRFEKPEYKMVVLHFYLNTEHLDLLQARVTEAQLMLDNLILTLK